MDSSPLTIITNFGSGSLKSWHNTPRSSVSPLFDRRCQLSFDSTETNQSTATPEIGTSYFYYKASSAEEDQGQKDTQKLNNQLQELFSCVADPIKIGLLTSLPKSYKKFSFNIILNKNQRILLANHCLIEQPIKELFWQILPRLQVLHLLSADSLELFMELFFSESGYKNHALQRAGLKIDVQTHLNKRSLEQLCAVFTHTTAINPIAIASVCFRDQVLSLDDWASIFQSFVISEQFSGCLKKYEGISEISLMNCSLFDYSPAIQHQSDLEHTVHFLRQLPLSVDYIYFDNNVDFSVLDIVKNQNFLDFLQYRTHNMASLLFMDLPVSAYRSLNSHEINQLFLKLFMDHPALDNYQNAVRDDIWSKIRYHRQEEPVSRSLLEYRNRVYFGDILEKITSEQFIDYLWFIQIADLYPSLLEQYHNTETISIRSLPADANLFASLIASLPEKTKVIKINCSLDNFVDLITHIQVWSNLHTLASETRGSTIRLELAPLKNNTSCTMESIHKILNLHAIPRIDFKGVIEQITAPQWARYALCYGLNPFEQKEHPSDLYFSNIIKKLPNAVYRKILDYDFSQLSSDRCRIPAGNRSFILSDIQPLNGVKKTTLFDLLTSSNLIAQPAWEMLSDVLKEESVDWESKPVRCAHIALRLWRYALTQEKVIGLTPDEVRLMLRTSPSYFVPRFEAESLPSAPAVSGIVKASLDSDDIETVIELLDITVNALNKVKEFYLKDLLLPFRTPRQHQEEIVLLSPIPAPVAVLSQRSRSTLSQPEIRLRHRLATI